MTEVIKDGNGIYHLDRNGKLFIAKREGIALGAYQDGRHMSIGMGSNDPNLAPGDSITIEEAFARFSNDISKRERDLSNRIHVGPTQEQFNAFFSVYYQAGTRIVPELIEMHNNHVPWEVVGEAFSDIKNCTNAHGVFMRGLKNRRVLEGKLYTYGKYEDDLNHLTIYHGNPRDPATKVEEIVFEGNI